MLLQSEFTLPAVSATVARVSFPNKKAQTCALSGEKAAFGDPAYASKFRSCCEQQEKALQGTFFGRDVSPA